jgi:hypothetical protein
MKKERKQKVKKNNVAFFGFLKLVTKWRNSSFLKVEILELKAKAKTRIIQSLGQRAWHMYEYSMLSDVFFPLDWWCLSSCIECNVGKRNEFDSNAFFWRPADQTEK